MITDTSVRPLQDQFMQSTPKETPKGRQMLAFIKVDDLLSKPSEAIWIIMSFNLNLVGHLMVCKIFFHRACHVFRSFERELSWFKSK